MNALTINQPLLTASIIPQETRCPFNNRKVDISVAEGECFWLQGDSGSGKTTISNHIAGLAKVPGAEAHIEWHEQIPDKTRVGVLFQEGVLIDTLTVSENIAFSCKAANIQHDDKHIQACLKSVGLKSQDAHKMPGELSGGMLRRAALAQILAQQKALIILDEPFVGLDPATAQGIIDTLNELKAAGQAFLLISHEAHYAEQLATPKRSVHLRVRKRQPKSKKARLLPRWQFGVRTALRLADYLGISLPLIICAFVATGLAISLLFSQLLNSINLIDIMSQFEKSAHLSWLQSLMLHMVQSQIKEINQSYLPLIKAKLYVLVLSQTFITQLGPLLTGLLLVGRIGGSYTGEVSMMQATNQNQLLQTLGVSARSWNLFPAAIASLIAAPILGLVGAIVALWMSGLVSVHGHYHVYDNLSLYWKDIRPYIFTKDHFWHQPIVISCYRSLGFISITLIVSELCGRFNRYLQPRHVPKTITWAIVIASLLLLIADWGFTEMEI